MYVLLASVATRGTNPLFVPSWPLPRVPWQPAHIWLKIGLPFSGSPAAGAVDGRTASTRAVADAEMTALLLIDARSFIRVPGAYRVDG